MKPDIVVCWPSNCDYPLWRQFIRENRTRFNLIIIVFTETHQGEDYRQFVRQSMFSDYVLFIDSPAPGSREDWRDVGIHQALIHSYNAPWLWFTEQDFVVLPGFWEALEQAEKDGYEVMATYDHTRMHPCNIFIKRETLMAKTRKNFSIIPDELDHFGMIQRELEQSDAKIYKFPTDTYYHYNGLSHNMKLLALDEPIVWNPEEFYSYMRKCLELNIYLDPRFVALAEKCGNRSNTINS